MAVLCFGKVSLYSVRGDLQLYVDDMEPQGQGALYLAFEQLKKKLAAEGLFAQERKRAVAIFAGYDWHRDLRSRRGFARHAADHSMTVTPTGAS